MEIRVRCGCSHTLQLPATSAGKKARCGKCGAIVPVPAQGVCAACGVSIEWSADACPMCKSPVSGSTAPGAVSPPAAPVTRRPPAAAAASGIALLVALILAALFAPLASCPTCKGGGQVVRYETRKDGAMTTRSSWRATCTHCGGGGRVTIRRSLER